MSECYSFVVNGVPCSTEEEKPLLRYLRDELRLTSVKDGCSEGACGTCTILVDGKAVKACVLSTKRAAGKEIVTVEGLSEAEREAFVYAFGAVGAVQCGFCIPGMVMAGKALLDQNPNPSEAEIKKAIRGNVCRCTGYKKIIEGIALAGAILRGEASVDPALEEGEDYGVGARAFRTDVRDKVLGRGEYCDDLYLDGMAHASAVRSQYPRARVLDIDPSAALALPGVLAVLTADDVPHNKVGHLQQDWDVMIAKGDITRCVGDAICLVVAENETVLKQAKELVKVDYEPLEPVRTIQEAMAEDAPRLHPNGNLCQSRHVTRGDAKAALANSKYVVTQSYRTPFTEHAFLEPECAVAFPYKDGVKVYTSDQGFYMGEHGWFDKRFMYEESMRTPLIMRMPKGFDRRGDITEMVQNIDYAPTFLELAGAPVPADIQGVSLLPLLKGEQPKDWRNALYYHFYEYPAEHMVKRHYGIRTERYKLIHFYNDINWWELYDMQADPTEMHNLYGQKEYEPVVKELKEQMLKLQEQYNDPVRFSPERDKE